MNSNFAKNLKQFKTLLFDGQHALAEQSLSQMQGQDAREKRVIGHQHGILKMRQGDFKSAIETLTQNLQDNGENLGCLLDLAACYYLDSQFFNWQKVLDHATQVFDQIHELLSAERVVITYLTLGKFIEEKGELAKALAYYQRAKEISEKRKFESFFAINALRAEAQILRLHLQYRSHKELTALYESLANHNSTDTDVDCDFEVQHALMLAEVRIFGLKVALARLANLQKNPIMQTAEASLIYSDLVTEFLLQGEKPAPELVAKFLQCASTSILDQSLSALINGKTIDLERIIFLKKQMPKAPYLRLLKILMSLGIETKSLSFIILKAIHSLGTESKKMWMEFQNIRLEQTTDAILFEPAKNQISYQGKDFSLGRQAAMQEMIELLLAHPEITCYEAVQKLWGETEMSEEALIRLRMRVHRFNKKIAELWSIPHLIEIRNNVLCLKLAIKSQ